MNESQADEIAKAVTDVLNGLVLQLVDTNVQLAAMSEHVTYLSMNTGYLVDELRTLNSAIGRIEDQISYRP